MQTKEKVSNVHEKTKGETHMKGHFRNGFRFVIQKLSKLRKIYSNEYARRTPYDGQRALLS